MDKATKCWIWLMELGGVTGCHQLPERSFFARGYQFPLCARCTGVVLSAPVAVVAFFFAPISFATACLLSFVMLFDWLLQRFNIKHSTNKRRLVTGLIGGYGWTTIHMYLYAFLFRSVASFFYDSFH